MDSQALHELQREAGFELSRSYLDLLRRDNGGEGTLPLPPGRCVFWPAEEVLRLNQGFEVDECYPGLFAFGSDGGQHMLAFDTRSGPPHAIVAAPFVGVVEEIVRVAPHFEAFRRLMKRVP
jgi:hypothetical protein